MPGYVSSTNLKCDRDPDHKGQCFQATYFMYSMEGVNKKWEKFIMMMMMIIIIIIMSME
jgi:hypothetical protein